MKRTVSKKKILIVEDELPYLKLLHSKLKEKGYRIIRANNGKRGLEKVKTMNPDLILLDVKMPVMDGISMLKLLRKEESYKKLKVIILTNFQPDTKVIAEIIRNKPSYYFEKNDIKFSFLLEKISELLAA